MQNHENKERLCIGLGRGREEEKDGEREGKRE